MIINYQDREQRFTENQLIAYIGNKRRLLPLIKKAFALLDIDPNKNNCTFYDPFAGTGVVSRFAATQGFQVVANDWEYYSKIINKAYLEINESEIEDLFKEKGGLSKILLHLNNKGPAQKNDYYIAKYYCPRNTEDPDLKNERLFYTRENGVKIDTLRNAINELYPKPQTIKDKKAKNLLLALLIYESSTRANTSGVFKAFHKGFGGTGKDALTRIMKPLALPYPILFENKYKNKVFSCCANKLTARLKSKFRFDVAYLDPPYNQHQYGSNYHLLNTIALDDRPPVNEAIYINGKKVDKSAIRKDWINTRSSYCYKKSAYDDFKSLIENLNVRYILTSYSIDGIIPFDDMLEILSKKGKLSIVTSEYTKYRGGKQALTTEKTNIEFLLMVDSSVPHEKEDIISVKEELLNQKINLYLKKNVDRKAIRKQQFQFSHIEDKISVFNKFYGSYNICLFVENDFHFNREAKWEVENNYLPWENLPYEVKLSLTQDLFEITQITKDREIAIILQNIDNIIQNPRVYSTDSPEKQIMNFYKKIPLLLKKFNNKKAYLQSLTTIQAILNTTHRIYNAYPDFYRSKAFYNKIEKIKLIIEDKISHKAQDNPPHVDALKLSIQGQYNELTGAA